MDKINFNNMFSASVYEAYVKLYEKMNEIINQSNERVIDTGKKLELMKQILDEGLEGIKPEINNQLYELINNGTIPNNVALLEDVTVDGETEDYIPLMALNGTEYRLTINNLGVPVVKNINGDVVFTCGAGGSSEGGNPGGSEGGNPGDTGGWTSGVAYNLTNIENSYVTKTGEITPFDGWNRTDYTNCAGASRITVSNVTSSSGYNCFYDLNKNFISCFDTAANILNEIEIPSNACYFMLSSSDNYSNITVIPYE